MTTMQARLEDALGATAAGLQALIDDASKDAQLARELLAALGDRNPDGRSAEFAGHHLARRAREAAAEFAKRSFHAACTAVTPLAPEGAILSADFGDGGLVLFEFRPAANVGGDGRGLFILPPHPLAISLRDRVPLVAGLWSALPAAHPLRSTWDEALLHPAAGRLVVPLGLANRRDVPDGSPRCPAAWYPVADALLLARTLKQVRDEVRRAEELQLERLRTSQRAEREAEERAYRLQPAVMLKEIERLKKELAAKG